jgi:hypothetical protein
MGIATLAPAETLGWPQPRLGAKTGRSRFFFCLPAPQINRKGLRLDYWIVKALSANQPQGHPMNEKLTRCIADRR